jgi:prevent-host-death family protein
MEKELGITEARQNFSEMVEQVQYQGSTYIIRRHGKPVAAVVPLEVYQNWKHQRKEFFALIRDIQRRADLEPEEAEQLAAEAIASIRGAGSNAP